MVDTRKSNESAKNYSDNKLFREKIGWEPNYPLVEGMKHTFEWIKSQAEK